MICERLQSEHAPEVSILLRDQRVARTLMPGGRPATETEVLAGLRAKTSHWERYGFGLWLLRDRSTGETVGRGGLQHTFVGGAGEVEVGWAIVPERWGQGLATELALASVDVAFRELRLPEIVAFALPDNVASRRVMEKAGFVYEREVAHGGMPHVLYRRARGAASASCLPVAIAHQHLGRSRNRRRFPFRGQPLG
jgi:[ribosomal protein S5]-alanine N-acetyltransferase